MSILDKANKIKHSEKKTVERYKALTVTNPTNSQYWYKLALCLFSCGDNKGAWSALTNAKKLGSEEAIGLILNVLVKYKEKNKLEATSAQNILLGKGV